MDDVFRAIADPTRRKLLDALLEEDGQSLSALGEPLPMTRFGVMKHLRVLEQAGLVVTRRRGREKLHYLNPTPLRHVHDAWLQPYVEPRSRGAGERGSVPGATQAAAVFETHIETTPERLWAAITDLSDAEDLEIDPPRRLVQRFIARPHEVCRARASRVTWEIRHDGRVCRLTVTRDRHGAEAAHHPSWRTILARLKAMLESGEPEVVVPSPAAEA